MATACPIAGAHKTKVLGFHPHEMHIAIGIEELDFRMTKHIETCDAIYATDCA